MTTVSRLEDTICALVGEAYLAFTNFFSYLNIFFCLSLVNSTDLSCSEGLLRTTMTELVWFITILLFFSLFHTNAVHPSVASEHGNNNSVLLWMYTVNATAADFINKTATLKTYKSFVTRISPTLYKLSDDGIHLATQPTQTDTEFSLSTSSPGEAWAQKISQGDLNFQVVPTIYEDNSHVPGQLLPRMRRLFASPKSFVEQMLAKAKQFSFTGFNFDFEPGSTPLPSDTASFNDFVDYCAKKLHVRCQSIIIFNDRNFEEVKRTISEYYYQCYVVVMQND